MIQFNLLPDVKLKYLKAEQTRRVVVVASALLALVSLAVLLLLFSLIGLQKKHLGDLNRDISSDSRKLTSQTDLNKILTVQNQLSSLTKLHEDKPASDRLFGYMTQIVPAQVNISNLSVDFTAHTITITGTADSIGTVNKFVDTLKFTSYKVVGENATQPAFTNIVLSSFGLGKNQTTYSISLGYDQTIFDNTKNISLAVPSLITTRSEVDKPGDLFIKAAN
ncbi:MAG TPA: PilN domain-containing protein [Candidatus Saccharimonadales bacterium]|nr:PilN domain-containing protein [Candidatus Saccharimonadales bacterium]